MIAFCGRSGSSVNSAVPTSFSYGPARPKRFAVQHRFPALDTQADEPRLGR